MNIRYLLMTAAILSTVTFSAARAEDMPMHGDKGKGQEMTFEQRKAKILQHMGERSEKMKERQACVQAAADAEALKACMPDKGKRGEHMKKRMKEHMGDDGDAQEDHKE